MTAHHPVGRAGGGGCYFLIMMNRLILLAFAFLGLALSARAREFDPRTDGFSFANETALAYDVDGAGALHITKREKPVPFSRRCFCMVRGALQFWKFVRFEPRAPRLSPDEYRARVRTIFHTAVWAKAGSRQIVVPGFANLAAFSKAHTRMLQEEIGAAWPTYVRVGNWRMACPLVPLWQPLNARWTAEAIERGEPRALYLTQFPFMNHAVVAYSAKREVDGSIVFSVYDPNYALAHTTLTWRADRRRFEFAPRFYFPGGRVWALPIYHTPLH